MLSAPWKISKAAAQPARDPAHPLDRRRTILLWAMLISAICGFINLGRPLEDYIHGARDMIRSQPYRGNVVVVAVDDRSIEALQGLNYPRRYDVIALDQLFAAGARRVFYDRAHADPGLPGDDRQFVEALKRHRGRVFLGAMRSYDARTRELSDVKPIEKFRPHVAVVGLNGKTTPFRLSARFPYQIQIGGKTIPSMSAALSERYRDSDELFRPDWSIQMRTVPTVSLLNVVNRRFEASRFRDKDVIIGPTSTIANDLHGMVGQGWIPGVYFQVVAAETLGKGSPLDLLWMPAWLLASAVAAIFLYSKSSRNRMAALALGIAAILPFPLLLDSQLITVSVTPALLLLAVVAYRAVVLRRVEQSHRTNVVSGLRNVAALHDNADTNGASLIVMRLRNLAEITASFDKNVEGDLINEIRRRVLASGGPDQIYHGEESLLWFSDIPVGVELADHLEGLKAVLSGALSIQGRDVDLSISFGVDGDQSRAITSRIGSAMLSAEEAAAANLVYKSYDPKRRDEASWQLSLLSRLDAGINRGEVWLAYQPQLHFASNSVASAEALVRWTHPERGLIGPDEFIGLAEKHNRIDRLTSYVLDQALMAAARVNARGIDFSVAINLPVQMLSSHYLFEMIEEALAIQDVPPHRLVLEITETGRLDRQGAATAMMRRLANHGVGIAIDDYGTGNATLDYLKLLPATEVKIDRQFIAGMGKDAEDRILVSSTIEMVHSLGRRVVAEGVETVTQLEALAELGCDVVQGYLIGKPMTEEELLRMMIRPTGRRAIGAAST